MSCKGYMGPRGFARAAQILTDSSAEERGETQRRRTLCDSLRLCVESSPPASKAGYSSAESRSAAKPQRNRTGRQEYGKTGKWGLSSFCCLWVCLCALTRIASFPGSLRTTSTIAVQRSTGLGARPFGSMWMKCSHLPASARTRWVTERTASAQAMARR